MDDWTYLYPDAAPDTQPALLDQDWRASEDRRLRAQQAEPPPVSPTSSRRRPGRASTMAGAS